MEPMEQPTPSVIHSAVAELSGQFVTKFIVLATVIDEDGSESIEMYRDGTSSRWDRMGLLNYALEVEKVRLHLAMQEVE
jgi:hypothetical protein